MNRVHTPSSPVRERERKRKRERERDKGRKRKREKAKRRKREIERQRERCIIWLLNFYFLKGMTGALAPFSHVVLHNAVT